MKRYMKSLVHNIPGISYLISSPEHMQVRTKTETHSNGGKTFRQHHSIVIGREVEYETQWKRTILIFYNDARLHSNRNTLTTTIISSICLGNSIIIFLHRYSVFEFNIDEMANVKLIQNAIKNISKWNKNEV